jgi:hypothetical protein
VVDPLVAGAEYELELVFQERGAAPTILVRVGETQASPAPDIPMVWSIE